MEAAERDRSRCKEAQQEHIGCTLDDIMRSHALVLQQKRHGAIGKSSTGPLGGRRKFMPAMQDLQSSEKYLGQKGPPACGKAGICSIFDVAKVDCASIFMQEAKRQEGLFKDSEAGNSGMAPRLKSSS